MTHEKIVAALREHAEWAAGNEWETPITLGDDLSAAADLIENQQREIEALRWANGGGLVTKSAVQRWRHSGKGRR